jgi:hypothetical protein
MKVQRVKGHICLACVMIVIVSTLSLGCTEREATEDSGEFRIEGPTEAWVGRTYEYRLAGNPGADVPTGAQWWCDRASVTYNTNSADVRFERPGNTSVRVYFDDGTSLRRNVTAIDPLVMEILDYGRYYNGTDDTLSGTYLVHLSISNISPSEVSVDNGSFELRVVGDDPAGYPFNTPPQYGEILHAFPWTGAVSPNATEEVTLLFDVPYNSDIKFVRYADSTYAFPEAIP